MQNDDSKMPLINDLVARLQAEPNLGDALAAAWIAMQIVGGGGAADVVRYYSDTSSANSRR